MAETSEFYLEKAIRAEDRAAMARGATERSSWQIVANEYRLRASSAHELAKSTAAISPPQDAD